MPKDHLSKQINLRDDEEIIVILHHHPITYAKQIAITAVLILIAFFLMFLLLRWGPIGVAIFLALLLTGFYYGLREFFTWYFNVFIITSQRIIDIDQKGFFNKTVSEADYEKILDISYAVQGMGQTLLKLGTISVNATGVKLVLKNIKNVSKVNQLITDLIREVTGKRIEAKQVNKLSPKTKARITDNFLNQEEFDDYDDFDTDELVSEYIETFGELPLKRFLVDELDRFERKKEEEAEDPEEDEEDEEDEDNDLDEEKGAKDEEKVSFKKKKI